MLAPRPIQGSPRMHSDGHGQRALAAAGDSLLGRDRVRGEEAQFQLGTASRRSRGSEGVKDVVEGRVEAAPVEHIHGVGDIRFGNLAPRRGQRGGPRREACGGQHDGAGQPSITQRGVSTGAHQAGERVRARRQQWGHNGTPRAGSSAPFPPLRGIARGDRV